jgi:broad specificity phosphatase PhoE
VSSFPGRPAGANHPIWLVRHAPTDWTGRRWCGRSDPELSDDGRKAAQQLAVRLAAELRVGHGAGVVVLSSPLRRALDTAAPIAMALGASATVDADLAEIDFGAADGLTWDELLVAHPSQADAILAGGRPDWPEGESAVDVSARARRAADRILDLAGTIAVVVVSHGGLLVALAEHLGGDLPPGGFEPASAHRLDPVRGV